MEALTLCNGCEAEESDPGSLAGYCASCQPGPLPGVVGTPHVDPIPRLRDASPEHPAPLTLALTFDGELDLFAPAGDE
jgi:hypothetical protein